MRLDSTSGLSFAPHHPFSDLTWLGGASLERRARMSGRRGSDVGSLDAALGTPNPLVLGRENILLGNLPVGISLINELERYPHG